MAPFRPPEIPLTTFVDIISTAQVEQLNPGPSDWLTRRRQKLSLDRYVLGQVECDRFIRKERKRHHAFVVRPEAEIRGRESPVGSFRHQVNALDLGADTKLKLKPTGLGGDRLAKNLLHFADLLKLPVDHLGFRLRGTDCKDGCAGDRLPRCIADLAPEGAPDRSLVIVGGISGSSGRPR